MPSSLVPKITISYRRADTDVMAGRIRDRLVVHYGEDAVFMDIDSIPFGTHFRAHIFDAVVHSDMLLVIVGQRWLGAGRGGSGAGGDSRSAKWRAQDRS